MTKACVLESIEKVREGFAVYVCSCGSSGYATIGFPEDDVVERARLNHRAHVKRGGSKVTDHEPVRPFYVTGPDAEPVPSIRLQPGDRVLLTGQPIRRRRFWEWLTRKPIHDPNGIYEVTAASSGVRSEEQQ